MKVKNSAIILLLFIALIGGAVVLWPKGKGQPLPDAPGGAQIERLQAAMLIDGAEYGAAVEAGGSVYDLMAALQQEKKINFQGQNYPGLGFFVTEINGIKNNPLGENWIYYVNGQPAKVGVSYYKLKNNDIVEWKYEKYNTNTAD
ncbi:MAG: DUF4430 domain-containing protein [Patescibacteria group bacterium]|nr:DUF4430 domain-containing protein [Patescibacteria group bacterium]